jgi:hypothetical protein
MGELPEVYTVFCMREGCKWEKDVWAANAKEAVKKALPEHTKHFPDCRTNEFSVLTPSKDINTFRITGL